MGSPNSSPRNGEWKKKSVQSFGGKASPDQNAKHSGLIQTITPVFGARFGIFPQSESF